MPNNKPQILLVEPDEALAEVMRKYFQPEFQVAACSTAQVAISAADEARPDMIVLELALPKHNGLAFLQEFRTYKDWLDMPIIIYSHIPREDTGMSEGEWHKQNVVSYLYKPTSSLSTLANHIRSNLNNYEIS